MDFIRITGLCIYAYHGVLPEEKRDGQEFFINAKLYYDMKKAGETDHLEDALNYADCCAYMGQVFTERGYDLIEAAAENLCKQLLLHYPTLAAVELELRKPHAPIGMPFSDVSVNMTRGWHKAYLAIGSNLGDKQALIEQGVAALRACEEIRNVRCSSLIETEPYGPVEQDTFVNGCIAIETLLDPEALLDVLHGIESDANRTREIHWGPRTLDLDIIFYDKLVYESDTLIIPHVDMQNRTFVLQPLLELCPNYRHPVLGRTVQQLLDALNDGLDM